MDIPETLGMRPGWIYEVVASTTGEHGPHAAPIGIAADGAHTFSMDLYKGSTTLGNILRAPILGINLFPDVVMLHKALYRRQELRFAAHAPTPGQTGQAPPFLEGAQAWLTLAPEVERETGPLVRVTARLARCDILGSVALINRAAGLTVESLVLSTRRHILPPDAVRARIAENARVVSKVAPGSSYESCLRELLALAGLPGA